MLESQFTKECMTTKLLYASYYSKKKGWLNASFVSIGSVFKISPFELNNPIVIFEYTIYNAGKEYEKYIAETTDGITFNIRHCKDNAISNVPSGLPYKTYDMQYVFGELADANVYDKLKDKSHPSIKIKGRGCEHIRDHLVDIKKVMGKSLVMSGTDILLPELIYLIREYLVRIVMNLRPKRQMELLA